MPRTRISTTVDGELLAAARRLEGHANDAALVDAALTSLLRQHRSAQLDTAYAVYDEIGLDEPDEWGDLASFRSAAGAS